MADTKAAAEGALGAVTEEHQEGSLLDQIMDQSTLAREGEGYSTAKRGVEILVAELARSQRTADRVDKALVDQLIAGLDEKLSLQLDEVMHNPTFQKMESAWRGLKYVVDHVDFRENVKVEFLNISKEQLLEDFEDSPEVVQSGLYKHAYSEEYGQFGGEPLGAMIANYELGPGPQDIKLLQNVASVAAMAHAPVIAAAGPKFFGVKDYTELSNLKDLSAIFEGAQYAKWQSFRESEDSRYVCLTMPRFLLRTPYDPDTNPVKAFDYKESVADSHEKYLWGNTAHAMASRLADSFAKYRWCPNIIGPQSGGSVEDLPLHQFQSMGDIETKIPTEVLISDRREYELAEEGFIALTMRKGSDNAAFFSANSVQKAKSFGNTEAGKIAETNYKLGTQLPYLMIVSRLAHYIKVHQREQLGSSKDRGVLQRELNNWIRQYVSDMENPSPAVRARRPLRQAEITVSDEAGNPGWYTVDMSVVPHIKYMGASFTLSLKGKLDLT